jgi:hypothetical protein
MRKIFFCVKAHDWFIFRKTAIIDISAALCKVLWKSRDEFLAGS